jgi:hypothetical protein
MKKRVAIVLMLAIHCSSWSSPAWARTRATTQSSAAPTSSRDATPKFNMNYFVGEWKFDSDLADTPLGSALLGSGTEVVRNVYDGRFWDVRIKGDGDRASLTGSGIIMYQDTFAGQSFVRYQVLGGLSLLMTGELGCDLGGTCNMYFETPSFEHNGSLLRLKGRYYMTSPVSYRLQLQISIDKEAYTNIGTIIYTKNESVKVNVIK